MEPCARKQAFAAHRTVCVAPLVLPRLTHAEYVQDHVPRLRFADGVEGEIDLARELHGEIFEPLRDKAYFAQFALHPERRTVVWPDGADFAPGFLRSALRSLA